MNSKFVAMGVLLAAPISLVSNARAQLKAPATVPPVSLSDAEPATVPPMDLTLSADLGAALYGTESGAPGGLLFGGTALYRLGNLGLGLSAVANGSMMFSSSRSSEYAALAGLSSRLNDGVRLDALGSLGWHSYSGWGSSGLTGDSSYKGASASMPCAGVRVRIAYRFSRHRRTHFLLGAELGYDADLRHRDAANYDTLGFQRTETVGGQRTMIALILGVTFDIGTARLQAKSAFRW